MLITPMAKRRPMFLGTKAHFLCEKKKGQVSILTSLLSDFGAYFLSTNGSGYCSLGADDLVSEAESAAS